MSGENVTLMMKNMVCRRMRYFTSFSILKIKFLITPAGLLSAQLVVISLVSQFVHLWLRNLGQTSIVANIMAGILLGPSLLGQHRKLVLTLFPYESRSTLATMSTFGNMFYHFLIAVKTDPAMMLRPGRAAMFIATTAFFSTMSLTLLAAMILKRYVEMDTSLYNLEEGRTSEKNRGRLPRDWLE